MTEFKKAFIDTSLFIYLLENNKQYYEKASSVINDSYVNEKELVTSTVTIEEYCVYPIKNNNSELIKKFFNILHTLEFQVLDINNAIAYKASEIRAEYPDFKSMDALQLAAAVISDCDVFFTNDKQLRQFKEIPVLTLDDYQI